MPTAAHLLDLHLDAGFLVQMRSSDRPAVGEPCRLIELEGNGSKGSPFREVLMGQGKVLAIYQRETFSWGTETFREAEIEMKGRRYIGFHSDKGSLWVGYAPPQDTPQGRRKARQAALSLALGFCEGEPLHA